MVTDFAFEDSSISSSTEEVPNSVTSLDRRLTPKSAANWQDILSDFRKGSGAEAVEAATSVYSMMLYAPWNSGRVRGEPLAPAPDGPQVINPQVTSTTTNLDVDGRLLVEVESQADVRVSVGDKLNKVVMRREITMYLVKNGTDWKIDGWRGNVTPGDFVPLK